MGNGADDRKTMRNKIVEAMAKGYETEECDECGNLTLARRGDILHCDTCGKDKPAHVLEEQTRAGALGSH